MGTAKAAVCRWCLLCSVLAAWFCGLWGVLAPLPALAAEYTPPTTPFTEPAFAPVFGGRGAWYSGGSCASFSFNGEGTEQGKYLKDMSWNAAMQCGNVTAGFEGVLKRLFWLTDETIKVREQLEALKSANHTDLGNVQGAVQTVNGNVIQTNTALSGGGSLYTKLNEVLVALGPSGQLHKDLATGEGAKVNGTVTVSNPTSVSGLEARVVEGTDTANQNIWAVFGMVVGFALLAGLWKLVRP